MGFAPGKAGAPYQATPNARGATSTVKTMPTAEAPLPAASRASVKATGMAQAVAGQAQSVAPRPVSAPAVVPAGGPSLLGSLAGSSKRLVLAASGVKTGGLDYVAPNKARDIVSNLAGKLAKTVSAARVEEQGGLQFSPLLQVGAGGVLVWIGLAKAGAWYVLAAAGAVLAFRGAHQAAVQGGAF